VSTPPPPPPPGPPEGQPQPPQPPQPSQGPQPPQQPPSGGWQPRPPDSGSGPYQQAPPQPSWAGGPAYPGAVAAGQLSGFWRRFGAYIIDAIIVGIASSIIQAILNAIVRGSVDNSYYARGGLISLVLGLIYFGYMWSQYNGQTLGYMALGVRLVRQDGGPISFGLAAGRYLVIYLSFLIDLIPAIISAFMIAFGSQKKAIQDYICGTLVVRT
jgi:uncharacterized RDD family membrane protein YckC